MGREGSASGVGIEMLISLLRWEDAPAGCCSLTGARFMHPYGNTARVASWKCRPQIDEGIDCPENGWVESRRRENPTPRTV